MSFHPDDDILDLIREAKEIYEREMKEMDKTYEELKKQFEPLKKAPIPPEYLEAIDGFLMIIARVGKNRVEIKQMHMEMLELHELQKREIDDIYERFAGLGEHL